MTPGAVSETSEQEIPGYNGAMDPETEKTAEPRHRGSKISLSSLLIVVTVLSIPLAWIGWVRHQVRREQVTITWVEKMGGRVRFTSPGDMIGIRTLLEKSTDALFGKRVRRVSLNNARVSDVSRLAELKSLKYLNLQGTRVSDEQLQELRQALPNCRIRH